ncbi:MAG: YfjI family protein [Alistipes senegalensis]|nr:YfjI family protein [Oxalobacter formigenes]MCM1281574.1 YfjI family protein [Alistipes senegalensis]
MIYNSLPFPVQALPSIVLDAVQDIRAKTQAPLPLIVSSVLGAMSLASQHLADVQRPDGAVTPISLYLLVLAESGERKSSVDALVMKPVHEYEQELRCAYDKAMADFRIENDFWKAKRKLLENQLQQAVKQERSSEAEEMALREHLKKKPQKPALKRCILTDATPAALQAAIAGNGRSVGVISDEAGMVFDGYMIQAMSLFNSLWSGKSNLTVDRAKHSYTINDARVTMLLQVQPAVFQKYMSKNREKAVGSGWLPRFIATSPISTQGTRFSRNYACDPESLYFSFSRGDMQHFHQRMEELLRSPVNLDENGHVKRQILAFSEEADWHLQEIADAFEARLASGQDYAGIREFATRFPDNIARLAALFHVFCGYEGAITLDTLNRAASIFYWYIEEILRLFDRNQIMVPEEVQHADLLLPWLKDRFNAHGGKPIQKNYIYQYGPNQVRLKRKLDPALNYLVSCGQISRLKVNNKIHIVPGPNMFPQPVLSPSIYPQYQQATYCPHNC